MDDLASRHRQLEITAEYGRFALRTHDMDALLQEATRQCAVGLQTELAKVLEYLGDERQFILRAGVGWKPGVIGHARTGADLESPAGYAFQTGKPVISNHLPTESRFRTPAILAEHGVKRAINVLIQGNLEPFGVLEGDSSNEGGFTHADLAFMQGLANTLGFAIERQRAEDGIRDSEIRLRNNEAMLHQSLVHQQVLTDEVSHRVKNSLNLVASLLNLQGRMSSDTNVLRALEDAQRRVLTIAQMHDRLWRAHEVHTVNLAAFFGELTGQLRAAAPAGCRIICEVEPLTILTDEAVTLGLLMNELVTNAFKYAYPSKGGDVRVAVKTIASEHLQLVVSDNGVGLPPGHDARASKSLGMTLINSLSRQLGGEPKWQDTGPGTRFMLDFFLRVGG